MVFANNCANSRTIQHHILHEIPFIQLVGRLREKIHMHGMLHCYNLHNNKSSEWEWKNKANSPPSISLVSLTQFPIMRSSTSTFHCSTSKFSVDKPIFPQRSHGLHVELGDTAGFFQSFSVENCLFSISFH